MLQIFQPRFTAKDSYYIFNHVDIFITFHSGENEDWGAKDNPGGRIVSAKLVPKR